jgi:hypothetical protein
MRTRSSLMSAIATLAGMLILSGWASSAPVGYPQGSRAQSRRPEWVLVASSAAAERRPPPRLIQLQRSIQGRLDRMDRELSRAAEELSRTGLSGDRTRAVLARLCVRHPELVDACTVDMKGRMITVEPRSHRDFEGSDISRQEQVIRLHRTKRPVLSLAFHAVEGFEAVDLEWPVFSSGSEMIGSVSLLMRPQDLLGAIVRPTTRETPIHLWVIQTDGRILYAENAVEIGRNLLREPRRRQGSRLRSPGPTIVTARSGSGMFPVPGQARGHGVEGRWSWVTVGLHGTEWRVIAVEDKR